VKRFFFLLTAAFAMAILDLISRVHLITMILLIFVKVAYVIIRNLIQYKMFTSGKEEKMVVT
jgi:hypothetical protein